MREDAYMIYGSLVANYEEYKAFGIISQVFEPKTDTNVEMRKKRAMVALPAKNVMLFSTGISVRTLEDV